MGEEGPGKPPAPWVTIRPMAVLSLRVRHMADYFRQQFAQVTNPPIDPLREAIVMSLETCIGAEKNVFETAADHANRIILTSPVLSPLKFQGLKNTGRDDYRHQILSMAFDPAIGLQQAIINLCDAAEQAMRDGVVMVILSDREVNEDQLLIPAAMATGAVHQRLVQTGLRTNGNILVETGAARDAHQFAVLIGFGATAVFPWLAYDVLTDLHRSGELLGDPLKSQQNFRRPPLKIKMGIHRCSGVRSEAVGLQRSGNCL